jgi:septal ring factor EnvC (AmiA/AmiB activator)
MHSRSNTANRHLSTGKIVLATPGRGRGRVFRFLSISVFSALIGAAGVYYLVQDTSVMGFHSRIAEIEQELERTREDLQSARMDLEISLVTRAELERQLAVLNEQHKQVREELEFVRSATGQGQGR